MIDAIVVLVDGAPPAKDGGLSIRNVKHSHHGHVQKLRESMMKAMAGKQPFSGIALRMDVHYKRKSSNADALNIINGISDILQRRCDTPPYRHDVWVLDDDRHIVEFHYTEEPADADHYEVTIRRLVK